MELIDNRHKTLAEDLRATLTRGSRVAIAASCFSIYAYQELRESLEEIEELRFVFTSPTFITERADKAQREFYIPRLHRERSLAGSEFEIQLRNELTQKAIARECAEWIGQKVRFKSNRTSEVMPGFAVVDGAAYNPLLGFTTVELGVERGDQAYTMMQRVEAPQSESFLILFDELWHDPIRLEEVTSEVIESISNVYRENAPELLYFLTLYHIFREFLDDLSEDVLPNEATGFKETTVWKKLYRFQQDACLGIINKLEKYNGCILADSVGLGKTFTAISVVKDGAGASIQGKLIWSKDKTSVRFQPKEVLPPNSKLSAAVRVAFEELANGAWKQVYSSGKPAVEEKLVSFTTGGAPENIPVENIVYAYPVLGQRYLLPKESSKGYVQLQLGQKYLFEQGFDYKLRFLAEGEVSMTSDFTYKEAEQRIEFTLPALKQATAYRLELSYRAKEQAPLNSETTQQVSRQTESDESLQIGGSKAKAQLNTELEQAILSYSFGTSRFTTFTEKIKHLNTKEELALDAGDALTLGVDVQGKEAFDEAEVLGVASTQERPLVRMQSELQENYFSETVLPLVYAGYPYGTIRLLNREEAPIGVPPYGAFSPSQTYLSKLSGGSLNANSFRFPFTFDAALVSCRDYRDLQSSVVNRLAEVSPEVYRRFILGSLPVLKYGKYKTWIQYVLPDGSVSSRVEFFYRNPLKLNK